MMHILRIEWLKLRKYRAFMVLLILTVAGILGSSYIAYSIMGLIGDTAAQAPPMAAAVGNAVLGNPFAFPEVFHTVAYISSFTLILPGLIVILLVSNEYSYRTHRQSVIDGLSRTCFITGKILLTVLLAVGLTLTVFLTACLFGAFGTGGFSFRGIEYVGFFFIQALSYMSVAMVVAMLVKRAGIGIGVYFVYALIAENVLTLVMNNRIYAGSGYFLPLESAGSLIPAPTMIGRMLSENAPGQAYLLVAAVVWIGLCLWFCKRRFEKSDL